jgi:hypothetical protein
METLIVTELAHQIPAQAGLILIHNNQPGVFNNPVLKDQSNNKQ